MASIRKRGSKWQVQVRKAGFPSYTKTFASKRAAKHWTSNIERRLSVGVSSKSEVRRLACVVERYLLEVTPTKKSAVVERAVLLAFLRTRLAQVRLKSLNIGHAVAYRDERQKTVSGSTIIREFALLSRCLTVAERDWQIHVPINIFREVEKPRANPPRNRRLAAGELARLLAAARTSKMEFMEPLIILALETAMRQGELLRLRWHDINPQSRQCLITESKNGYQRSIPLTDAAMDVLTSVEFDPSAPIFRVTYSTVRQAWRRLTQKAHIQDLHFHDLRHEAISRLVEYGLPLPEVGTISGHRDTRTLLRYAHPNTKLMIEKPPASVSQIESLQQERLPMQAFEWLPEFAFRSLNAMNTEPDWPGHNDFDHYSERVRHGFSERYGVRAPTAVNELIDHAFGKRIPVDFLLDLIGASYRLKKIS